MLPPPIYPSHQSPVIISGTGHRPGLRLGPEGHVRRLTDDYLTIHQPTLVISGMALGFDQILAESALALGFPLLAAIPHPGQPAYWKPEQVTRWMAIKRKATHVEYTSPGYHKWCMFIRNEWMVEHSNELLAWWDGKRSGTARTIEIAMYARHMPRISNIYRKQKLTTELIEE